MSLEATLLGELKALRGGTGLTDARLREQVTLTQHLAGETISDKANALVTLVASLQDEEQRQAVRYAFGIEGGAGNRLTKQRRKAATEALSISERTLIRREIDGLIDLAHAIIERSPSLTEQQRETAMTATATAEDRIADLEKMVAILARKALASDLEEGSSFRNFLEAGQDDDYEELLSLMNVLDMYIGEPKDVVLIDDEIGTPKDVRLTDEP